jgi:tetratricopeptide (TPR) repeat protein
MRKLLLLSFLWVFSLSSIAQELIISDETITESYLLRYENSNDRSQQVINYMIGELGRMSKRNRGNDQVIFSYNQTTRITRKDKQVNMYLTIKNFRTATNIEYRGFPLIDVLIPQKVDMSLQLITKSNQSLANYSVDGADFNSDKNDFTFRYTDTSNLKDLRFLIKSKKFTYTDRSKSDFNNKLSDIDLYYDLSSKMSMAFKDMAEINPDNLERLFDYDNMLKNIDHLIRDTEGYRLDQKLNLRESDPAHFHQKLDDLRSEAGRQHSIVNHTIAILYQKYYDRALNALVNGNEALAVSLFEKSLYNNPVFAPSALQLAKIDYKNNRLDEAASKVRDIYSKMNPDPETASYSMELVNKIYNSYLDKGLALMNEKSYQQALEVFNKTRDFCRSIPGFYCSETLSNSIAESKHGIYKSFLENARTNLKNGDLTTAEKEVKKAMDYYNANPSELKTNSEAVAVLNDIKFQEHNNLIAQGKIHLKSKNYQSAFQLFQDAEKLESDYSINKSVELPGLLKQSAKPIIISDLKNGLDLVKQNRIDDAKRAVISSYSTQNAYNLSDDKDINKLLEDLRKKIYTQECINAQNNYDLEISKAKVNISNRYYLLADQDFAAAFKVTESFPNCMINKTEAINLKNSVQPAIDFQNKIIEIDEDVKNKKYSVAIALYLEVEKRFNNDNIASRFGLTLIPLMDYIPKQENSFVIFSVNYYTIEKNYENALKLLEIIKSRGNKSKVVKNEQKNLGTQLAIRDHAKNGSESYKTKVLEYSRGDKWYNDLKKYYLKQWKKLK